MTSRYHRQQLTSHFTDESQATLSTSRVVVVGLGGLGCPVAHMLVGAGVGHLHLIDADVVATSNLHRQTLYTEADVGSTKVSAAAKRLQAINSEPHITTTTAFLHDSSLAELDASAIDLIVDCSDSPICKTQLSRWAIAHNIPCVIAAISQDIYSLYQSPSSPSDGVCWDCLSGFGNSCAEQGVLGPIVGMAANAQALAALKRLLGATTGHEGRYLLHDTHRFQTQSFGVKARKACDCQTGPSCSNDNNAGNTQSAVQNDHVEIDHLDPAATWIDIRSREEIEAAPLSVTTLHRNANLPVDEWADALQADTAYILICARGLRSHKLASALQALGFAVRSLSGGAQALNRDSSQSDVESGSTTATTTVVDNTVIGNVVDSVIAHTGRDTGNGADSDADSNADTDTNTDTDNTP